MIQHGDDYMYYGFVHRQISWHQLF